MDRIIRRNRSNPHHGTNQNTRRMTPRTSIVKPLWKLRSFQSKYVNETNDGMYWDKTNQYNECYPVHQQYPMARIPTAIEYSSSSSSSSLFDDNTSSFGDDDVSETRSRYDVPSDNIVHRKLSRMDSDESDDIDTNFQIDNTMNNDDDDSIIDKYSVVKDDNEWMNQIDSLDNDDSFSSDTELVNEMHHERERIKLSFIQSKKHKDRNNSTSLPISIFDFTKCFSTISTTFEK